MAEGAAEAAAVAMEALSDVEGGLTVAAKIATCAALSGVLRTAAPLTPRDAAAHSPPVTGRDAEATARVVDRVDLDAVMAMCYDDAVVRAGGPVLSKDIALRQQS